MLWQVYIATNRVINGEYEVDKHLLDVPGTSSMSDCRIAIAAAAKHFNATEDRILCIPAKKGKPNARP